MFSKYGAITLLKICFGAFSAVEAPKGAYIRPEGALCPDLATTSCTASRWAAVMVAICRRARRWGKFLVRVEFKQ